MNSMGDESAVRVGGDIRAARVAVMLGSRRPHRRVVGVGEWVLAGAPQGVDVVVVDLDEIALPTLCEQHPPMFGNYELDHTRKWSSLVAGFDAFVLVTPEYNHTTTPALLNALDHLYVEWRDKPVGFVGYGVDGGVRAVEHLRQVTAELGMVGVGPAVALNVFDDFDDAGACNPRTHLGGRRQGMWEALLRLESALRPLSDSPGLLDSEDRGRLQLTDPHRERRECIWLQVGFTAAALTPTGRQRGSC